MPSDLDTDRDTTSSKEFFEYYAAQSESALALERSNNIYDVVTAVHQSDADVTSLDVLDLGCNAGTQSLVWAEHRHKVYGLDINAPLIELARSRARERDLPVQFHVGTAERIPLADGSVDVCLAPELLEHVPEWERCVSEMNRVLRPGGVLFLTTTNCLCPVQEEFELPLYSWYPAPLKRRYERLAVTTRPELVNHATYPAVHWFSFFQLERYLQPLGYSCLDRFDVKALQQGSPHRRFALRAIRTLPPLRWLAHVLTPYTYLVGVKQR